MPIQLSGSLAITGSITTSTTIGAQGAINTTNATNPTSFTSTASLYTDGGVRVAKDMFVSGTAYFNNMTVYGTQSVQYITSSQLNIGTNLISVNTDTPAIRFGGLAVYDSGSTGLTGSMLWDSEANHWVYSNPSGSSYSGGMLISGPRSSALGSEQGTTFNALMKGQGGDHITSSGVFEVGGSVGIGTTSPTEKLSITSGNIQISAGYKLQYSSTAYITPEDNTNGARIVTPGALNIATGGTSVIMTVDGSGYVGIGSTSPAYKLDVQSSGSYAANFQQTTNNTYGAIRVTGNNRGGELDFYSGSTALGGIWVDSSIGGNMHFALGSGFSEKMFISGSGNVGIGTTSPSSLLHVTDGYVLIGIDKGVKFDTSGASGHPELSVDSSAALSFKNTAGSTSMFIKNDGNVGIGTTIPGYKLDVNGAVNSKGYVINGDYSAVSGVPNAGIYGTDSSFADGFNSLIVASRTDAARPIIFATYNGSSFAERVRIKSDGNVGIGTSSPGAKLHIIGTESRFGGAASGFISVYNATDRSGYIQANGGTDLRIASDTDPMTLYVNGSERMRITSAGDFNFGNFLPQSSTNSVYRQAFWGAMSFLFRNAEDAYINSNHTYSSSNTNVASYTSTNGMGRLGLGGGFFEWLTYNGSVTAGTGYSLSTKFIITSAGNVGIGTSSPISKLHVSGDMRTVLTSTSGGDTLISAIAGVSNGYRILVDTSNNITYSWSTGTNTTAMTINSSGNVGIATTSPSNALSIGANAHTSPDETNRILNWYSVGSELHNSVIPAVIGNNNNSTSQPTMVGLSLFNRSTTDNTWSPAITFGGLSTSAGYMNGAAGIAAQLPANSDGNFRGGNLVFYTSGIGAVKGLVEKMRIQHDGNVGIGTTSPSAKFQVTGSSTVVNFQGSGSNIFTVDGSSGRLFSVDDDLTNSLFSVNTIAGLPVIEAFADNTVKLGKYSAASGSVMNITGSYVGIGTSVPAAALHVVGNQYTSKASGGGTFKQVVVGQTTAASSGVAKKIAYVGFTHSVRVYIWVNQSTAHGSSAIADICTVYGSSNGGTVVESNYGNVTDISVAYNNGGSPAYTIDISVTYSGTAPTINYVIEGISWDNNIYTL